MDDHEKEILKNLEPLVEKNLYLLTNIEDKKWCPAQFFSFMEQKDYQSRLEEMRNQAKGLSDELLVVLIGDMITEEALPSYAMSTQYTVQDGTGVSPSPWAVWQRGWNSEENQHGDVLHQYLLLCGRVNMESLDKSTYNLIQNGFRQNPDVCVRLFYPMFQEPATRISHTNVAKIASKQGDETLANLCRRIAGDEHRHAQFYLNIAKGLFEQDPDRSMRSFYDLMKEGVVMPAHLMTEGIYKPPKLFDHFANVALSTGVYTAFDYAGILDSLNKALDIPNKSVTGDAARAQDYLGRLPSRIRKIGERQKSRSRSLIPFDWLYGRKI